MPRAPGGKRNAEQEKEVLEWIGNVVGEKIPGGAYEKVLKDGILLCKLMNKLKPNSVDRIQTSGGNFKLMENVERFINAAREYGVPDEELFQTVDLFEAKNIPQVTLSVYALGRITQLHSEYTGPALGPKMSEENKREFTEEQLRAGEGHIGLQAGYNKGASQAGINMGKRRMVQD